jgi:hypothetical protein
VTIVSLGDCWAPSHVVRGIASRRGVAEAPFGAFGMVSDDINRNSVAERRVFSFEAS